MIVNICTYLLLICRRSLLGLRILIIFSFSSQSTITSSSWDSYSSVVNEPGISTGGDSIWREFLASDSFWREFWRIGVSSFWNVQSQSGLMASFVVSRKQKPFSWNVEIFFRQILFRFEFDLYTYLKWDTVWPKSSGTFTMKTVMMEPRSNTTCMWGWCNGAFT